MSRDTWVQIFISTVLGQGQCQFMRRTPRTAVGWQTFGSKLAMGGGVVRDKSEGGARPGDQNGAQSILGEARRQHATALDFVTANFGTRQRSSILRSRIGKETKPSRARGLFLISMNLTSPVRDLVFTGG
jgi:hypothetical protein